MERNIRYNTDWAERLAPYELDSYRTPKDLYNQLVDEIRQVEDGAFSVTGVLKHLRSCHEVICQVKEMPWEYMYDCMKLSLKDFCIKLPSDIADEFLAHVVEERRKQYIYGWYDAKVDGIRVFAYTGNVEDEENTYPAYDGYGRYDTYYEIVEGVINREGKWMTELKCRYV